MYQATVLAEPLTSEVAELNGEPETRNGGWIAEIVVPAAVVVVAALPAPKPNAPSAACAFGSEDEAVIDKLAALSVCNVMTPPLTVEGVEVPVIESIAVSRFATVPVVGLIL